MEHSTLKENRIFLSSFLLISSHIIYDLAAMIAFIGFNFSFTDYPLLVQTVRLIIWVITIGGYLMLSFAAKNKAVRDILKITAAAFILQYIIRGTYIGIETMHNITKPLLQALAYIIGTLAICYLWGAVKRNYDLEKKHRALINCYMAFVLIISPIILQIGIRILSFSFLNTAMLVIEFVLLYTIIKPAIFCAESKDIPTKEQYRFWNKYHLWIIIGLIATAIGAGIINNAI